MRGLGIAVADESLVLRCGGLVYCLVGAWLEVSIVWAVWSSVCVVVGVSYFMLLSFFVLSGGWRIFGQGLGVLICEAKNKPTTAKHQDSSATATPSPPAYIQHI